MPKIQLEGVELSFEAAIEKLEKIVEQMESSKLPLEELIVRYEEGIRLVGICNERLASAEHRIETLTREATTKATAAVMPAPPMESTAKPKESTKDQDHEISLF
jgi:exodeoxyribonuclease VII small subunit